jgi:acyl-CoA dehydrogenase
MDFEHSERAQKVMAQVQRFLDERILPHEQTYLDQLVGTDDWRQWKIPPIVEELKAEARELGLWNLFLPDEHYGAGLDNRDYAPIAEITGRSFLAPEVFNCSAPDTGNAEVLVKYGSEEQKQQWLEPLLAGETRSGFAMTEPAVASSDATNMKATCEVVGDEVVLNGQKWWTSGAGDPRCAFFIFMGVTDPEAGRHERHSMVLCPADAPGVKILRMLRATSSRGPAEGSRLRRDDSDRAGFTTACGRSARPSALYNVSASGRFIALLSANLFRTWVVTAISSPTRGCRSTRRAC